MNIDIVAIGAATSIGSNSNISAASVLAGMGRNHLHALDDGTECHVAALPNEDPAATPGRRMRALLVRALGEIAERLEDPTSVSVYLAAPGSMPTEELLPDDTRIGALHCKRILRGSDASGLACLKLAFAALQAGECDLACLAGVDVRTDEATLEVLNQQGLLLTDESPWGFIAGEGAGAVLLATDQARSASKLPWLATVRAFATETESATAKGLPCVGEALSRVCHEVLAALPTDGVAGEVYADLNGERTRTTEWGYTLTRIGARCRDAVAVSMPALLWGEVGHATGALLLQLAASQLHHGHARGTHALVWTAGRDGARSALLLQRSESHVAPVPLPAASSQAYRELDQAIVDELLSDASFLFEQRRRILEQREHAPAASLLKQERVEHRLERHLEALALGGDMSFERAAELQEPGVTYTTARLCLRTGAHARLWHHLHTLDTTSSEVMSELRSALVHGATSQNAELSEQLLASSSMRGAWELGLWLAAELGLRPNRSWSELAHAGGPRVLGASFPYALIRLRAVGNSSLLDPWLQSECVATRELAALACLMLDRSEAYGRLLALSDATLLPVLALLCKSRDQTALLSWCERSSEVPSSALALGLLGTLDAISQLESRLKEPALARPAAKALYLASGAALLVMEESATVAQVEELTSLEQQARAAGDADVGVEREKRLALTLDPGMWRAACEVHRARFRPAERARLGQPLSATSDAAAVIDQHLAPSAQRLCAYSLGLRSEQAPLRHDARVLDQQKLAAAASRAS
jgi:3-oxoacyl-[acyl-carrier-protein] synthase-1